MAAAGVWQTDPVQGKCADFDERDCRRSQLTFDVDRRLSFPHDASRFSSKAGDDSQDGTLGSTVEESQLELVTQVNIDPKAAVQNMPGVLEVHELLGVGSFSHVYSCTIDDASESSSGHLFSPGSWLPLPFSFATKRRKAAVKLLQSIPLEENREIKLLLDLHHPHLVGLLRVVDGPPTGLVLELCAGGTLHELVHGKASTRFLSLDTAHRATPALDVAVAIDYLHSKSIVHRDVKSKNCFLTVPSLPDSKRLPPVKLGDLGCARAAETDGMTRAVGSVRSMAPEVITGERYGLHADIFSFAVLLHELVSGQAPYAVPKRSNASLAVAIVGGLRPPIDVLPQDDVGRAISSLLQVSWCVEPEARLSSSEVVRQLNEMLCDID
eukprot:gnl/TRDRNA2_/TRDRNA2_83081_c0_seq1.p1 gnl/TRDRNA2_/TRDRNA2_83081_c0~~gnl/TRDRNA2_/TRDRNA2_83081_c0_seq1.p1  ORF type:complete len:394 (-),score=66.83 gnl/TRDRNA2_/TRDRNA2_83081_c0_seq1:75-1220(-)